MTEVDEVKNGVLSMEDRSVDAKEDAAAEEDDEEDDEDDEDEGVEFAPIDTSMMKVISITKKAEEDETPLLAPSKELEEWVTLVLTKRKQGIDFNDKVRKNREFRNPAMFEKMVAFCELDEYGTNLPPERFGLTEFERDEYYKELAAEQEAIADGRNMAVATTAPTTGRTKRSKWDTKS